MTNKKIYSEYTSIGGYMDYILIYNNTKESIENIIDKICANFIETELNSIGFTLKNE